MMWDGFDEVDEHVVPNPKGSVSSVCISTSACHTRFHSEAVPLSLESSEKDSENISQQAVENSRSSDLTREENDQIVGLSVSEDDNYYLQAPAHKEKWDSLLGGNLAVGDNRLLEGNPTCLRTNNAGKSTCITRQLSVTEQSSDFVLSRLFPNNSLCREYDSSILAHPGPFSPFNVSLEEPKCDLFGAEDTVDDRGTLLNFRWEDIDNLDDMDTIFLEPNASLGQDTDGLAWSSSQSLDVSTIMNTRPSKSCPTPTPPSTFENVIGKTSTQLDDPYQGSVAEADKEGQQLSPLDLTDTHSSVQTNELSTLVNVQQPFSVDQAPGFMCYNNDVQFQGIRWNESSTDPQCVKTEGFYEDSELSCRSYCSAEKGGRARGCPSNLSNKFRREISHKRRHSSKKYRPEDFQMSMQIQDLQLRSPELWGLTPSFTTSATLGGHQHVLDQETLQAIVNSRQKEHKWEQLQDKASMLVGTRHWMYPSEELGSSNHEIPMSGGVFGDKMKDRETSAEEVLYQLQALVLKLNARTRLCFRDALYRLAKSAMHRRGVGDNESCIESSEEPLLEPGARDSAHEDIKLVDSVQRLSEVNLVEAAVSGKNVFEAETNRIDRRIANMLFQKFPFS